MKNETTPKNTRQRVLESACVVFAQKGYRDATIAEICDHADANVASVNYYFGDKETLYDQVWRYAYKIASDAYPLEAGIHKGSPADLRLAAVVSGLLHRIFCREKAGVFPRLVAREIADPTHSYEEIAREILHPEGERIGGIIRELLGGSGTDEQICLCMLSVLSQCVFWNLNNPLRELHFNKKSCDPEMISKLSDHILRFSLAGIREIRNGV
jgi:AcrR family transcriptional regulator